MPDHDDLDDDPPACPRCWDDGFVDDDDAPHGMARCPSCGGRSAHY